MNYLAHVLLSENHIDYQLGNLLTDRLKARVWAGSSAQHQAGMKMHKNIDRYTDAHPAFLRARDRLVDGYLRGVVIDVTLDHFLTKHWDKFVRVDFDEFVSDFYQHARQELSALPEDASHFVSYVIEDDILRKYRQFDDLIYAFGRIDARLSEKLRARESTSEHFPVLAVNYDAIEQDFLTFFPDLVAMFLRHSDRAASLLSV